MDNFQYEKCSTSENESEEEFPQLEEKGHKVEHNILFTNLTEFLIHVDLLNRQERQIDNKDIKEHITSDTEVDQIVQKIDTFILNHPEKYNDPQHFDLSSVYFHINRWNLIGGFVLCIGASIAGSGGILLLDVITNSLKDYHGEANKKQIICLLLIGIILVFLAQTILQSQYQWIQSKWSAQTRTMLQYLIFQKGLRTPQQTNASKLNSDSQDQRSGKDTEIPEKDQIPDVYTLISIDVEKQLSLFWGSTQFFTSLLQMGVVLYLIYYKIGDSILVGLNFLVIIFIFNILTAVGWYVFNEKQMKWNDKRIGLSKDVIEGMKTIKYFGWENIFKKKIEDLRSKEFLYVSLIQAVNGVQSIFRSCMNYILLFIFLISYVNQGNELGKSNVFTMIALLGYFTVAFNKSPWTFSYMIESQIAYERIQKFLNQTEVDQNPSICETGNQNVNKKNHSNIVVTTKEFDSQVSITTESSQDFLESVSILIKQSKFQWHNQNLEDPKRADIKHQSHDFFHLDIKEVLIQKGEMVVVIGKIGSGKTAFLSAILNELEKKHETQEQYEESFMAKNQFQEEDSNTKNFIINGSIAYVSQNHWLQNKTVKENILFGEAYKEQWYNYVLKVTDLNQDISTFIQGDAKIIATGGGNLSGGQKQRIALCRALYANKDIYLLDDILSSLDTHVADVIFQKAIVELLVRKLKKTVIMTSSHFGIFSKRAEISQIYLMENGTINKDSEKINAFINSGFQHEQEIEQEIQSFYSESQRKSSESYIQDITSSSEDGEHQLIKTCRLNQDISQDTEEHGEIREKGEIKRETFTSYFESMGWANLVGFVLCTLLMLISQMTVDFWLGDQIHPKNGIFKYINGIYNSFGQTFFLLIAIIVGVSVLKNILYCSCALISDKKLFLKFNQSLFFSKMKFFDKTPSGTIVNRLSHDILMLDQMLPYFCNYFLESLVFSIGYPLGVVIQFPYLLIFVVTALWMIFMVQKLFRISNREVKRLNSVNSGKVLSVIDETCNGVVLIRSFKREKYILKEFLKRLSESINSSMLLSAIQVWIMVRLMLINNLIFTCVCFASIGFLLCDFPIEFTSIAMCLTYSIFLSRYFTDLMTYYCQVEQNIISVERLGQYFENDQEILDQELQENETNPTDKYQEQIHSPNENIKQTQYSIEFQDVYISYHTSEEITLTKDSANIEFALKEFSLKIRKGEKIAFCGRTGSGKTSILNTLFGMYPIQFGSILVHGKNIKQYSLRQLREQMSIIPQFGFLYNESLLRNLDPEGKIPKSVVETKINATSLFIRNKHRESTIKPALNEDKEDEESKFNSPSISSINNDLDLEIDNGGGNLSSGERQIVNFLRVILRDTDIICLDEASSNMDPKTDALLHQQIFKLAQDKTLLVITHRLENIDHFDRVVVMDKGKIVECGPIQQLRENKEGFFSKQCQQKQCS